MQAYINIPVYQITNICCNSITSHTHSKLPVNVLLSTSFGCKIEPSSGHFTSTVQTEYLYNIRVDSSPLHQKVHCKCT